jgi:hypothetical protein
MFIDASLGYLPVSDASEEGSLAALFPSGLPKGCYVSDASDNVTCEPIADQTAQANLGFLPAYVCCAQPDGGGRDGNAGSAGADGEGVGTRDGGVNPVQDGAIDGAGALGRDAADDGG